MGSRQPLVKHGIKVGNPLWNSIPDVLFNSQEEILLQ